MHWVTAPPGLHSRGGVKYYGTAHDGTVSAHNPRRADIDDKGSSIYRGDVVRLSQKRKGKFTNSYPSVSLTEYGPHPEL